MSVNPVGGLAWFVPLTLISAIQCGVACAQSNPTTSRVETKIVVTDPTEAKRRRADSELEELDKSALENRLRGYFDQSLLDYRKQLEIQQRVLGKDHWKCAVTSRNIADTQLESRLNPEQSKQLRLIRDTIDEMKRRIDASQYEEAWKGKAGAKSSADALFEWEHVSCLEIRWLEGIASLEMGDPASAEYSLEDALLLVERLYPTDHPMRLEILAKLGAAERMLGKRVESGVHLRTGVKLSGSDVTPEKAAAAGLIHLELAKTCCEDARWSDALAHCDAAMRADRAVGRPNAMRLAAPTLRANIQHAQSEFDQSYRELRSCLRSGNSSERETARLAIARNLVDFDDRRLAITLFSSRQPALPAEATRLERVARANRDVVTGWARFREGKLKDAARAYQEAILATLPLKTTSDGLFYFPQIEMGWVLTEGNQLTPAETMLTTPSEAELDSGLIQKLKEETRQLILAYLRVKQNRLDEAKKLVANDLTVMYQYFGQEHPRNRPYLALRAKVLRACGPTDEARRMEALVARIDWKLPDIRARLAVISAEEDKLDAAAAATAANGAAVK